MSTTNDSGTKAEKPEPKKCTGHCEYVCPTCGERCQSTEARDHGTGQCLCAKHFHLVHQAGGA